MSFWKRSASGESEPAGVTLLRDGELSTRLESLMANATDHIRRERELLLEGARVPRLPGKMRGRPVVVVSRAHQWQADLASLKRWIRDRDPVLIAVANGAESLLDAGYKPDVVIGSLDQISDLALNEAREVVVTASSEHGKAGAERFEKAGVDPHWFIASGGSSDLALLLAEANGASVIVVVGGPRGLADRLAGPPDQVASSFVSRLRANAHVVDAPAVGFLSSKAAATWPVVLLLLCGVLAVAVAIAATPVGQDWWTAVSDGIRQLIARYGP
jgi:uncharacterized membrane-anchored protein